MVDHRRGIETKRPNVREVKILSDPNRLPEWWLKRS
jgi:hypothetical protein